VTRDDHQRIAKAIAQAERGTTGCIAVRIVNQKNVDAFQRAKEEFERAGMHRHEHENAVLILVAPQARRFAVIGDRSMHERVGDAFWTETADAMRPAFASGSVADGILAGVERVGDALHRHFAMDTIV
jgi:uncharacterized membrane protein